MDIHIKLCATIHTILREMSDAERSDPKQVIDKLVNMNKLYTDTFDRPGTITKDIIRNIVLVLLSDMSRTDYETIVRAITNIIEFSKTIGKTSEIHSARTIRDILSENILQLIFDFLGELMVSVQITPKACYMMNNTDSKILKLVEPTNEFKIVYISFTQKEEFIRKGSTLETDQYNSYNRLVGRYGYQSSHQRYISGSYLNSHIIFDTKQKGCILQRLFYSIDSSMILIHGLDNSPRDIHNLFTEQLMKRLVGLIIQKNLNPSSYYGIFSACELTRPFCNYLLQTRSTKATKLTPIKVHLRESIKAVIPMCNHIQDMENMLPKEFQDIYVIYEKFFAYCKLCYAGLPEFNVQNILYQNVNANNIKRISNFVLFNNYPYSQYKSAQVFVGTIHSRIKNILRITVYHLIAPVSQQLIDTLISFKDHYIRLEKRYRQEISEGLFFPKISNQLFMIEMYEKEQFAEKKTNNMMILHMMVLFMVYPTFLINLIDRFRSLFSNKGEFFMPAIDEIIFRVLVRLRLIETEAKNTVTVCWNIYSSDELLIENLRSGKLELMFLHEKLSKLQFNFKDVLKSIYITDPNSYLEDMSLTSSLSTRSEMLLTNSTNVFNVPQIRHNQTVSTTLKPSITVNDAENLKDLFQSMISFKYSYNLEDNQVIIPDSYNILPESTNLSYTVTMKLKGQQRMIVIDPINDVNLIIEGNEYYHILYHGDPIPTSELAIRERFNIAELGIYDLLLSLQLDCNKINLEAIKILAKTTKFPLYTPIMSLLAISCFMDPKDALQYIVNDIIQLNRY